jgi:Tat protein translocase TatB subunit
MIRISEAASKRFFIHSGVPEQMFGTLGGPELFLILVVALIVFGPRKLPDIGKSVGKMMAEFRKASNDFKRTIEDEVEAEKLREATRIEVPSWSSSEPAPAALPAATVDQAGDSAVSSAEPGRWTSPAEAVPAASESLALAEAPTVAAETTADAPSENAPPAPTVSRGTVPDETR